jgi:cell shape-determining protein MreC
LTQETTDTPSEDPQHPPLVTTDLVTVRVLGQETIQAWQAGRILDRGRGLSAESLVVEPGHTTLDVGRNRGLARGQPAYAGRRVAGRISRVGRWTSTLQPLTDTRFRGLARLARPGRDQPVFSTRGMLEGTGDGFCRLTLVPATAAVAIGDVVYTDGRDQPDAWPMVYGTVVQAELSDGAPHWDIRIRPAIDLGKLKQLDVLTRRFHRPQANSQGVLAQ